MSIIFCIKHAQADKDRLVKVVRDNAYDFYSFNTMRESLSQIERVYNRGLRGTRIYFSTEYEKHIVEANSLYMKRWKKGENKFED